jgi:hypothetical protein
LIPKERDNEKGINHQTENEFPVPKEDEQNDRRGCTHQQRGLPYLTQTGNAE